MPHQPRYRKVSEQLVNYDWTDVIAGVGYVNYYPYESEDTKLLATTTAVYATSGKLYSNATAQTFDEDFDLTIDKPFDIDGTVLVTIPIFLFNNKTDEAQTPTSTLTVYIRKYSGTTETNLASDSVTTAVSLTGVGGGTAQVIYSFTLPVAKTHFASGDILRYTITGTSTGDAQLGVYVYRDPANRSVAIKLPVGYMDTTRTTIAIPMKIED